MRISMTWQALSRHPFAFLPRSTEISMRAALIALLVSLSFPALADPGCKEQVDTAFAKLRDTKAFRLETTIKNPDGMLRMQADYVLPDRMYQRVRVGTDNVTVEMIVIGDRAWSNQGGGWAALPQGFAQNVAQQIRDSIVDAPKDSTDYTCAGDQELEGKTYTLYRGILADASHTPGVGPNQQSVYIDKETGLPVRNIVTPVSAPDKRLFDGTFTIVQDLKIEEPKTAN